MRTNTISAAATGRPDACTSETPFSSICQVRDSTRIDNWAAIARPRVRSASESADVIGNGGDDFDAGDEMGEFGKITQNYRWISTDVILLAQFLQRDSDVAFHQGFEQVDHAHAIGQTQHLPHILGPHWACGVRNCLIEQRE